MRLSFIEKIKFNSVGMKVFGFYVASMLVIITVMGYLSYDKSSEMMENKIGGMVLQNVQQMSKRLDILLEGYEDRSLLVVGNRDIQKQLIGDFKNEAERIQNNNTNTAFLSNLVNSRNDINNIYLLSENGFSYRYSPKDSFPVYNPYPFGHFTESWYKQIRQADGKVVYFGIVPSLVAGPNSQPVFSFGRTQKNLSGRGEIIGVLLYEIDPAEIMGMLAEIDYDGSGMNVIADETGRIIGDKDGFLLSSMLDVPLNQERQGISSQSMEGEETLVVYNRLETNKWTLVGMLRGSDLMKEAKNIRWYMLTLGVVFSCIGILFAIIIASTVHRPLQKMIHAMRKAKKGDFDIRVMDKREDEFGYLFIHFNEMVARIKELINELYVQKLLKQDIQLKMLGSQINAHFLYNTLDSVHWIARIHKVDDISTMIFGLSKYLRLSLNEGKDEVLISQVVHLIDSYIMIQKVRYQDKFSLHVNADESLMDYKVLKFIFQPIVENAIYHGLEKKSSKGRLDIAFMKDGSCLKFVVADDGAGIEPDKLSELKLILRGDHPEEDRNFALRNINSQIKIAYGMQYGIEIESRYGEGTKVTMTIPLLKRNHAQHVS
ncbi:cache domain-containing sensor histidine kinase [Paenibacillus mendelii]|uniref:Sensor histidine kinase n=1 Tax=Paenibacillus mendelii TaxID=206163 RepID=A0ABV6J6F4_9BACL|nr:sensor histidine kinase [Paenibacillus mendelii]MCQ6561209.1 sensor histidine kinase [Paenibacillus mendelii]